MKILNTNSLQILIYHRVLDEYDPLTPCGITATHFYKQIEILSKYYHVLQIDEALALLASGNLPPNSVSITFDDGYKDCLTIAFPILKSFNLSATVFVATGYLNKGMMWNDSIKEYLRHFEGKLDLRDMGLDLYLIQNDYSRLMAYNAIIKNIKYETNEIKFNVINIIAEHVNFKNDINLMLSDNDVIMLNQAGFEIAAHTHTHPILTTVNPFQAYKEILKSKVYLQLLLNKPINYFAYPNGKPNIDFKQIHCNIVKELGFKAAFTTYEAALCHKHDMMQIPRFTPWDVNTIKFRSRLFLNRISTKKTMLYQLSS